VCQVYNRLPERAAALRTPLLRDLAQTGADALLSANIGCRLHLGAASPVPVLHPLEFLAAQLAGVEEQRDE
jgi:glycolate oxidase iron-sulfur subunit